MSSDEIDELWLLFEQDASRSLDEAEDALLALQGSDADAESLLNQLYRGLHSIKGNARAMGLEAIEGFTHRAEDLVALCRDGTASMQGDVLDAVLESVDGLRRVVPSAVAERRDITIDADNGLHALYDKLQELVHLLDTSGARDAATDEDFLLFDEMDFSDEPGPSEAPPPPADLGPVEAEAGIATTPANVAPTDGAPAPSSEPAATTTDADSAAAPSSSKSPSGGDSVPEPAAKSVPERSAPAPARKAKSSEVSEDESYIQVKAGRVRELLALASDLGLAADVVVTDRRVQKSAEDFEALAEKLLRLKRLTRDLRFASSSLALVPVSTLFTRLRRVARDLARQTGKAFDVHVFGDTTEVDRFLIDQLYDPMMHIMRNAVDHGLEDAQQRARANKPAKGRIELRASSAGQGVVLEIRDDGAGLNRDAILDKARRRGLVEEDAEPADEAVWRLIMAPGFSTKEAVSNLSGRGVGMDVVNQTIQRLRGSLQIRSETGRGSTFRLQLPVTLAFADVLLVDVEERAYAIPLESIRRILTPTERDFIRSSADSGEFVRSGDHAIPVVRLNAQSREATPTVVAIRTSQGEFAVPVAHVLGTEQVTLRPLNNLLSRIKGAAACGLMANGEVAVTLDCEQLVNHARA